MPAPSAAHSARAACAAAIASAMSLGAAWWNTPSSSRSLCAHERLRVAGADGLAADPQREVVLLAGELVVGRLEGCALRGVGRVAAHRLVLWLGDTEQAKRHVDQGSGWGQACPGKPAGGDSMRRRAGERRFTRDGGAGRARRSPTGRRLRRGRRSHSRGGRSPVRPAAAAARSAGVRGSAGRPRRGPTSAARRPGARRGPRRRC